MHNSTLSDTAVSNSTISDNGSGIYNDHGALSKRASINTTMSNNGVEIRNMTLQRHDHGEHDLQRQPWRT